MALAKKHNLKRFSILLIRPGGGASTFSVSPFFLFLAGFFAIIFGIVSVAIMQRYFILYLEHRDLLVSHQAATEELSRLQNLYSYQIMVSRDYAKYVHGGGIEQQVPSEQLIPVGTLPLGDGSEALELLEAWAAFFPDPLADEKHELEISEFEVKDGEFKFRLLNEAGKRVTAQGFLLLLFTVLYPDDNQLTLVPYPEFDPKDREPDFISGISYNMRSSKLVSGALPVAKGARVVEMMAVAQSKDGLIVLKQKLLPSD